MKLPSNAPPARNASALWAHFSQTYFSLRLGLALLALAFPLVLYAYGRFRHGLDLQPSMSAYFFAATAQQCASFPMRTLFVGFLFAIGVGLHLYKGFSPLENMLLNLAGACAVLVAVFPERLQVDEAVSDPRMQQLFSQCPAVRQWAEAPQGPPIHYLAAVTLFVALAVVAWACAGKTLDYLPPEHDPARFRRTYRGLALLMVLCPLTGWLLTQLLAQKGSLVFFVEAAGVCTFGVYWLVKSRELALSQLESHPDQAVQARAAGAGR